MEGSVYSRTVLWHERDPVVLTLTLALSLTGKGNIIVYGPANNVLFSSESDCPTQVNGRPLQEMITAGIPFLWDEPIAQ